MKDQNYLDVSCPQCGTVPKHGHLCTPPKDVEEIEAAIKIEIENCGGDTALLTRNLTNLITTHTDKRVREERQETMRTVMQAIRRLVDEPQEAIYLEEIEEALYELDEKTLSDQPKDL